MPLIKCKKCVFAVLPEFAGTNYICVRKAPKPSEFEGQKAYWKLINREIEGCGEGEVKKADK